MFGKWTNFRNGRSVSLKEQQIASINANNNKHQERHCCHRIYLDVQIFGQQLKGLLDTGATISVLGNKTEEIWKSLFNKNNINEELVIAANGKYMKCLAKGRVSIDYQRERKEMKVLVIPEVVEQLILGINFFHLFNLKVMDGNYNEISMMHTHDKINSIGLTTEHDITLNESQKGILSIAINKFTFSSDEYVGCQKKIKHHIDTGNNKAICQRLYQYSPEIEAKIKKEIERWLRLGYIEPTNTDWRHPIVPVIKKNGKVRCCLDARKLNGITKSDTYTSPDLNNIFRRFPQANMFFSVDLTDAFMQTELDEESKEKTAFGIPGMGTYHFNRMPFGLRNAAATQSRVMNSILGNDLEPHVFHYLDDIIVATDNFEHMIDLIETIASRLTNNGLTINPDKLEGPTSRIKFIGRIFDSKGQHPDEAKVEAIKNIPVPKTVKEVRSLVGVVTWYSHFVKNFSSLMTPITSLIKKKAQKVVWNEKADKAFQQVKEILTSDPILRPPDYRKPFIVQCDASLYGIGGVLAQLDENNREYVISYYSHKLTKAEQKYHAYERECLAVIKSLDHFKPYIYLQPIIIMTDHHSLTQTLKYNGKSGRLMRWSLILQPHAHQIVHRAGIQMVVADALSRAKSEIQESEDDDFKYYRINAIDSNPVQAVIPLNDEQLSQVDNRIQQFELLRRKISEHPDANASYRIVNNRLYMKTDSRNHKNEDWREIPHPTQEEAAIKWAHLESLHGGVDKTMDKLKERFYWKSMRRSVQQMVKSCTRCAHVKIPNYSSRGIMPPFHMPKNIGEQIQIDYKGPFPATAQYGYKYIIVAQEALSRYLIAECTTTATVDNTIQFLKEKVLTIFPNIKSIKHDRASQFLSKRFTDFLQSQNITPFPTASYAPHQNPVERCNRVIGEALAMLMLQSNETHTTWHRYLKEIISKINNRKHEATKLKPYVIVFGKDQDSENQVNRQEHLELIKQAYDNSKRTYELRMKEYNKKATVREFTPGTWVMARYRTLSSSSHNWMSKLAARFQPVKIIRKLGHNTYEVMDKFKTIHVIDVRSIKDFNPELEEILKTLDN